MELETPHTPELSAQQYLLRAVIESPRDIVIFALDREYRYLAFNEAHRRTMADIWDADIKVGTSMFAYIGREDDRRKAKEAFDRALGGEHFTLIQAYGNERISRRYYENVYGPIVREDGAVIGLTVFLTDITEERKNQQELEAYRQRLEGLVDERTAALRRSEELYRMLVMHAPTAVLVHRGKEVLYANPAAEVLAGASAQLTGRSLSSLFGDAAELAASSDTLRREVLLHRTDGSLAEVEWTSIGVPFEGGPARLSLATDVSERKRAEADRRRMEEKLLHTQKLESLGLLAGGIAHDFNNLLVGILGNADLALRNEAAVDDLRVQLERIKASAVHAAELTGQLLAYSGKRPFNVRPLELRALTREMSDLMKLSIPKNARLSLDLEEELPAFEGDAAQIRQIIMNLITNAADAVSENGGDIRVRTYVIEADTRLLAGSYADRAIEPGPYVCLEVMDTGSGMNEQTRARLFDPFFTTKAKGRGLGLAAVVGIVRAHRGAILVSSDPGKGSTFRVLFPITEKVAEAESAKEPAEWHASGTILIADDEPRVRQVIKMMLTDIGFRVLEAEDAQACLSIYRSHGAAINAIMVDLTMPGGGGQEVVRVLRAEGHRVPVVVSSGYSEKAIEPELRSDSRLAFLEKPFDYAAFVRALRTVLEAA